MKSGWTQSFVELVHADTLADLLEMAAELLTSGYRGPAAVTVGCVLEAHLRALGARSGVQTTVKGKPMTADAINAELKKKGIYSAIRAKQVTSWLGIRNAAAHGLWDEFTDNDVRNMIETVADFLERHPA